MDHPQIETEQVVERYARGQLTVEEQARFEQHYLGCAACLARVEAAERGLLTAGPVAAAAAPPEGFRWSALVALWGLAGLAVIGVGWAALDLRRQQQELTQGQISFSVATPGRASPADNHAGELQQELETLRQQLTADEHDLKVRAAEARGQRDALDAQLAAARQPQSPTLVALGPPAIAAGVPQRIAAPETAWVVLTVELPGLARPGPHFPAYRMIVERAGGDALWQSPDLVPLPQGALALSLPPRFLRPGDYQLILHGLPAAGAPVVVGRYALRLVP